MVLFLRKLAMSVLPNVESVSLLYIKGPFCEPSVSLALLAPDQKQSPDTDSGWACMDSHLLP